MLPQANNRFKRPDAASGGTFDPFLAEKGEINLSELNLNEEVSKHFASTKALMRHLAEQQNTSDLVRAYGQLTSQMQALVKMSETLHNIDRLKKIEATLIDVMRTQPDHVKTAFFNAYEKALTHAA
jgi:hypothetical protein